MAQSNQQLEPLELNPWRVLVVAAHPGDIERGTAAAVAVWTKKGAEVIYLVATRGEWSIPGVEPESAALIRSGEQLAAAAAVGVSVVDFLDMNDGTVEPSVRLRRDIVRDIRRFRPDVVVTMNHREQEADGTINDPDHRAVGAAAIDAVGAAANQWAFRDIGEAHTVDVMLVAGSPASTHAIDVTGFENNAAAAFSAHEQHLASLDDHPMADPSWLASALKADGQLLPEAGAALRVELVNHAQGRPCHSFMVKDFVDPDGRAQVKKLSNKSDSPKGSVRARNAEPHSTKRRKKADRSKAKPAQVSGAVAAPMKLKVRLEQRGRSIGIEVPASVMERLGDAQRPTVTVEVNDSSFDTTVGTNNGSRFIAINAERRKQAGIEIDDTFFVALSTPSGTNA